jgi:PAS domain S-box-containing protein
MKYRVTPTAREQVLDEGVLLVSKTDTKGRITYGNRAFIELSGYSEAELLGAQHNIVRHPDMPRGVFHLLWNTVAQDRREIFAYVKNMARDGSYYWVFANVTPSLGAGGSIEGYFSVRRKPAARAVAAVSGIYREMLQVEERAGPRDACEASVAYLQRALTEQGKSYEEFILAL